MAYAEFTKIVRPYGRRCRACKAHLTNFHRNLLCVRLGPDDRFDRRSIEKLDANEAILRRREAQLEDHRHERLSPWRPEDHIVATVR